MLPVKMTYKYNKRWRLKNPGKRYSEKLRYYGRSMYARNHMQPWNISHIDLVLAHVIPDRELASLLGRSVAAAQKCRWTHVDRGGQTVEWFMTCGCKGLYNAE